MSSHPMDPQAIDLAMDRAIQSTSVYMNKSEPAGIAVWQ